MDLNDNKRLIRREVSNQHEELLHKRKRLDCLEDELMDRKIVGKEE